MSAVIAWTDADGSASLGNIPGFPDRFDGWTPDVNSVGDSAYALGTGQLFQFEYRVDDLVSLRIDNLKGSQLTYMRRLKLHLLRGGEVTVSATNELNELYTTCTLAPDTRPTISEPTRENREYSFSVTLRAGTAGPGGGDGGTPVLHPPVSSEAGLVLWVRAKSLLGAVNDAAALSLWPDLSGNGNDLETDADAPSDMHYEILSGGTEAVVRSISPQGPMSSPLLFNPFTSGATLFVVARRSGAYRWPGDLCGFCTIGNASGNARHAVIRDGQAIAVETDLFHWSNIDGGSEPAFGAEDEFCLMTVILNGSIGTLRFNGVDVLVDFVPNTTDLDATLAYYISGGGNSGSINAEHKEHILYEGILSTPRILEIEEYLMTDHGIGVVENPLAPAFYRSASTTDGGSQSDTIVQDVPDDVVDGQMLLWGVHIGENLASIPWPAGWTEAERGFLISQGDGATLAVAWRVADSEPASYTMTLDDPEWFVSTMVSVRSVRAANTDMPAASPVAYDSSDKTDDYWLGLDPVASPWDLHADHVVIHHTFDLVVYFGAVDNSTSQTGITYQSNVDTYLPAGEVHSVVENTNWCSLAVLAYWHGMAVELGSPPPITATGTGVAGRLLIAVLLTVP